jgi:hypothetical protein
LGRSRSPSSTTNGSRSQLSALSWTIRRDSETVAADSGIRSRRSIGSRERALAASPASREPNTNEIAA